MHRPKTASPRDEVSRREFALLALDGHHVAAYKTQTGFRSDGIPLTYFYLLAQRAQLSTMLSPLFGFKVAGLVHDTGRLYARLSGDYNPIHLWPWSARLLGFKRPIIHGMHTVGRAVAEIEIENATARVARRITAEVVSV
jgi:hypothetical protein